MPDPNILEKINLDNTEYLIKDGATETLTTSEVTTGTNTDSKFVTAKVLHDLLADSATTVYNAMVDYISSLDATSESY